MSSSTRVKNSAGVKADLTNTGKLVLASSDLAGCLSAPAQSRQSVTVVAQPTPFVHKRKATKRARILALLVESGETISFAEIGRRVGLSRERVRKIARQAGSDAHESGRRQEYTCAQCGGPFTVWPSKIKRGRRFCSAECACRARGPRVPRLIFICEVCGQSYTRKMSELKRGTRFCSKACHGKWLTNEFRQTRDERGRFRPMARERGRFNAIAVEKLLCGRTTIRA